MSITISIVTSEAMRYLPFVLCGTYWGWLYLRYIQRIPESNITGTPGDEFALSTFFPQFIRYLCLPLLTNYLFSSSNLLSVILELVDVPVSEHVSAAMYYGRGLSLYLQASY